MSNRQHDNGGSVLVYACSSGHHFFFAHKTCPVCDLELVASRHAAGAMIISQTTVRVSPAGRPFRLGVARVECGAQTLCLIEENVPHDNNTPVILQRRGDLYHATIVTPSPAP